MHPSIETNSSHKGLPWSQRIVLAGTPIGLFFGTWGYLIYGKGETSFPTAFYHAIQLFALHMPLLEGQINWQLEVGRWAAATSAGLMIAIILKRGFLTEWQLFLLRMTKKHVIVCGLGDVGKQLALDFKKSGSKVVAIERSATAPGVAEVESHGITVFIDDAKGPETLRKLHAHYAKYVLAVCSDDDTNIAIAVAVRDLAVAKKSAPKDAVCLLLLADSALRDKVAPTLTSPGLDGEFQIKVGGFDMPEMLARLAFEEHPLDFDGIKEKDLTHVHLVVVGTGPLGEALAIKALQLCHFANRSRPRLTIVGNDAQELLDRLKMRHPYATEPLYDAQPVNLNRYTPQLCCGWDKAFQLQPHRSTES